MLFGMKVDEVVGSNLICGIESCEQNLFIANKVDSLQKKAPHWGLFL